jgi:hypothetical protein
MYAEPRGVVMKRSLFLVGLIAVVVLGFNGFAVASTAYEAKVKLHPKTPVTITPTSPVQGRLQIPGTRFQSIDSACFTFTFSGDLLDPGESVFIDLGGSPQTTFGFQNVSSTSTRTRTVCIVSGFHDALLALLLDGKQRFELTTEGGSVTVASVQVVITGQSK